MVGFTLTEIWLRIKFVALAWILLIVGGSIIGGVLSALVGLPIRYAGWTFVFLMAVLPRRGIDEAPEAKPGASGSEQR